jgi:uncharacterized protein (DUF362 family)
VVEYPKRSTVALMHGPDRHKNAYEALLALDREIRPKLLQKKRVVIKPNCVAVDRQLGSTHVDTLRAILDYLAPRYKGEVAIAESSVDLTTTAFHNFKYASVIGEYRSLKISLVDLDAEARSEPVGVLDRNLHPAPMRIASRIMDPDAFVFSSTIPKAHNTVVVTLSVKNMVVGSALKSRPTDSAVWSDKRLFHNGYHLSHYNILLVAQKLLPYCGVSLIDGYEGMEGEGPMFGTPVPSRIAIASTDFIAADRVAVGCMGVDPNWVGYLKYCGQFGLGNYDLSKIDVQGAKIQAVTKKFKLAGDVKRQLLWMGNVDGGIPQQLG